MPILKLGIRVNDNKHEIFAHIKGSVVVPAALRTPRQPFTVGTRASGACKLELPKPTAFRQHEQVAVHQQSVCSVDRRPATQNPTKLSSWTTLASDKLHSDAGV